jgi:hypothetical protein
MVTKKGDYFLVRKTWAKGDEVKIEFSEPIVQVAASICELYFQRGPLVYALNIPANRLTIKKHELAGFEDWAFLPVPGADWFYSFDPAMQKTPNYGFTFQTDNSVNMLYPFDGAPVRLEGKMINRNTGKDETVSLIPMGSSLASLRRVTFPSEAGTCQRVGLNPSVPNRLKYIREVISRGKRAGARRTDTLV